MTTTSQPTQMPVQQKAILALTEALENVLQQLEVAAPADVSIFFNGTELYRYQASDGSIFWWGDSLNS